MSKLNISSNLFLEVNEINRLIKFLKDDGYKLLIRHLISTPGGIAEDGGNTYFKPTINGSRLTINAGIAFDHNLDPIILESDKIIDLSSTSSTLWVILSRATTNNEQGTVNVSALGALTGTNTEFTKVLRGQPNFPTKVKLVSNVNTNEYEVVDVSSDTLATLAGSFQPENNVKYQVIGTFTPGYQPSVDNRFIYEYDDCNISVIESDVQPVISDGEFILASITQTISGRFVMVDERFPYLLNGGSVTPNNSIKNERNSVAVLTRTRLVGEHSLQMFWEFGVKVTKYDIVNTASDTIFSILGFKSTFFGENALSSNVFNGWMLLNRSNMKYAIIESNDGPNLYIREYDSDLVDSSNNDFIIIPNYDAIEVEIQLSGELYEGLNMPPYYSIISLQNPDAVTELSIDYGTTNVALRYRMLRYDDNVTTLFQPFNISQFINNNGVSETLGASSFNIVNEQPVIPTRNYS